MDNLTDPKYIKLLYKAHLDIHNLFVNCNIAYWSSGGTTLGAIRHKGIIGWDNDIDLEISHKDVKTLMSKDFKKLLEKKGYKIRYHREPDSDLPYDWVKIYSIKKVNGRKADIDLFPIYFDEDNNGRMRTYFYSTVTNDLWPNGFLYLDELLPLKTIPFGDGFMVVPKQSRKYLTRLYGKSWSKVGYITQNPDTHFELDEPIKVTTKGFHPANKFHSAKLQIELERDDILLTLKGYGFL